MSALNPFDKEGKPNATFADRIIIALTFLFFIMISILLPFLINDWYQKTTPRNKALFWLVFVVLAFAGAIYNSWLYSE